MPSSKVSGAGTEKNNKRNYIKNGIYALSDLVAEKTFYLAQLQKVLFGRFQNRFCLSTAMYSTEKKSVALHPQFFTDQTAAYL